MARNEARLRRPRSLAAQPDIVLVIPDVTATLTARIGSSQVDQFVLDHGPADVLRELVQNEFDGGGEEMTIHFGREALTVSGSGKPVTASGWTRLSVIMGTGEVIGDEPGEAIEAKQNGIGSKNFGLRSVFYFSDRIHVRSNGQMAILDVRDLKVGRQADPGSTGRKGVIVQAPFRQTNLRRIPAFTIERERDAFDEIKAALFPTLLKLAIEGKRGGLRKLALASDRLNETLEWRQSVKPLTSTIPRVKACRRTGNLTSSGRSQHRHDEVEFARYVELPRTYRDIDCPAYYRHGDRVKVAVSLTMHRRKIDTSRPGRFYYPLEASQQSTGCALSVSAPFALNADRSRLSPKSDWNNWLNEQAAALVVDLVGADWFGRFGPASFEALAPCGPADADTFQALVAGKLKSAECWPRADGGVAKAQDIVVPGREELFGHLNAEKHLHPDLSASAATANLALYSGAKPFTLNSLVRLRCAGANRSVLETKPVDGEADYHFTSFPARLLNLEFQTSTAAALEKLRLHLSNANRKDLAETETTLAADGQLARARGLVVVPADMWEACPVPSDDRLHPELRPYGVIARQCIPFDLTDWIKSTASRARDGTATESERLALYTHLLAKDVKLAAPLLAFVRHCPVLRNAEGTWTTADELAWLPAKDHALLEPVLRTPAPALRTKALMERFRIRRALKAEDLTAMAEVLVDHPEKAVGFETLLARNMALLTPRIATKLSGLEILRDRRGNLAAPSDLHLPTPINRLCLEASGDLVDGENEALYRRLHCRETPSSGALLRIIEEHRDAAKPPPRAEQLYAALVEALKAERRTPAGLQDEAILYVGGRYAPPASVIANPRAPLYIRGGVPTLTSAGPLQDAYLALGASYSVKPHHWAAFLIWIDARSRAALNGRLSLQDRANLREGYGRHISLPEELGEEVRCLLTSDGDVATLAELRDNRLLENDYPALADALIAAGSEIKFGDDAENSRTFLRLLGIRALSQICGQPKVQVGSSAAPPSWFRGERRLKLLHNSDLPYALAELASAHRRQVASFEPARSSDIRRKLNALKGFSFVASVELTYTVGKRVRVPAEAALYEGGLAMTPPAFKWEFEQVLAGQLAQIAGARHLPDIRSLVSSILPLVSADSDEERSAYLKRLGIRTEIRSSTETAGKDEDLSDLGHELVHDLFESLQIQTTPSPPLTIPLSETPGPPPPPPKPSLAPPSLPDPAAVTLTVTTAVGTAPSPTTPQVSSDAPWRPSGWNPRTSEEQARDAAYGRQGEAIVYHYEIQRLKRLGIADAEQKVVWTSTLDPGADHDIQSIAEDGSPIWIEVKSTSGADGRFDWSKREFEKALREGPRYQLWRVYGAGSSTPIAKLFEDPIALLRKSVLRLEIGDLRAFVEGR